jgi:hypothetical protein
MFISVVTEVDRKCMRWALEWAISIQFNGGHISMEKNKKRFYEQARLAFQRLSPEPGDLVCVTFPKDMMHGQVQSTYEAMKWIHEEFNVDVILLTEGVSMSVMKEEDMNKLGWFKREPAQNLN